MWHHLAEKVEHDTKNKRKTRRRTAQRDGDGWRESTRRMETETENERADKQLIGMDDS